MKEIIESIILKKYPLYSGSLEKWSKKETTQSAFREASRMYLSNLPQKRDYSGRGIVICGGGKLLPCVWVAVNALRYHQCTLPIQIWYLGLNEFDAKIVKLMEKFDVEFVDTLEVAKRYPSRILNNLQLCSQSITYSATLGGWTSKIYSIINSPYEEVMLIDADNSPTMDPSYLFNSEPFQKYGAYFFPDKFHGPDEENFKLSEKICKIFGVPFKDDQAFDSGQMIINKSKCWSEVCLTMWWNDYCDYTYQIIHGDKDTFHLAWLQTDKPYYIVPKAPISGNGLQQFDHNEHLIFLHRSGAKWSLAENKWLDRPQEQLLHSFIDDLKNSLKQFDKIKV